MYARSNFRGPAMKRNDAFKRAAFANVAGRPGRMGDLSDMFSDLGDVTKSLTHTALDATRARISSVINPSGGSSGGSGTPGWVMPAAIGGGVLVLALVMMKK